MTEVMDAPVTENAGQTTEPAPAADWRAGLELEPDVVKATERFKDVGALAKSYAHADRMISSRAGDIAGDPELVAMMRAHIPELNPPESADHYEYDLPEIEGWDEEMEGDLRNLAHELGVPNDQFGGLMSAYAHMVQQQTEQAQEALHHQTQQAIRELKGAFGGAYERKLDDYRMVRDMLPEDVVEGLMDAGVFADARVVRAFAEIGEALSEGGMPGAESKGAGLMTPDQAQREIDLKMSDPGFMGRYMDRDNPGHKAALAEMEELHRMKGMRG